MKQNLIYTLLLVTAISACVKKAEHMFVTASQRQVPVLTGKEANEILKLEVVRTDNLPAVVERIRISSEGTTSLEDLESVSVFYTGDKERFSTDVTFSTADSPLNEMVFKGNQPIEHDTSYFWVSYKLKAQANLFNSVDATLTDLTTTAGSAAVRADSTAVNVTQQLGVAVRQHRQDGVHTYRIPGLTTTSQGTLLACYDVRRANGRDLQGDIDIGISRSTDDGQTWEPMHIALDMGEWGGLPQKFNGVSDACLLADTRTGEVYVAGLWMYGVINSEGKWLEGLTKDSTAWNHQWRNKGSQAGYGVKQTSQFLIAKSKDDGVSWGAPVNITKMVKKEEEWLYAPAPGHGITMEDGTLVFPTQGRDKDGGTFSNITYSQDGGKTWKASARAYLNTTESMVAQLDDESLMLNMRDNRNRNNKGETNGRAIAVTSDMGETWTEHSTSHGALIESVCMASLHKHVYTENGEKKSMLLFSNPNNKYSRIRQTIKVSFDNGETWPEEYWILLDEGRGAGYSCITSIDENTIGILYEGSQAHMTFQKISLDRLRKK
ncbi:MAG: exo-alpha-sialidase [Cytophagales bacterium]|nr:exo-alpha-sialidase [Cytophagales bacterium]